MKVIKWIDNYLEEILPALLLIGIAAIMVIQVIAKEYAREQAIERSESRIREITSGGGDPSKASEIVTISDDLRAQMREKSSALYEQIRRVVNDDDLFYTCIREEK